MKTTRFLFAWLFMLVAIPAFVACGDDDDDSKTKPDTEQTGDGNASDDSSDDGKSDDSTDTGSSDNTDHTPAGVEAVDLGLPSGTLWANMNVGATSPEGYGDYFAWGETEPKDAYTPSTYKWYNDDDDTMTKYNTNTSTGYVVDYKTTLDLEDDAARANWGGAWRMPTLDEIKELTDDTTSELTTLNGVNGRRFTSKTNGRSVFLPAAGYPWDGKIYFEGLNGFYWSSTLYERSPYGAWYLGFGSSDAYCDDYRRHNGFPVRPVRR